MDLSYSQHDSCKFKAGDIIVKIDEIQTQYLVKSIDLILLRYHMEFINNKTLHYIIRHPSGVFSEEWCELVDSRYQLHSISVRDYKIDDIINQ